jgi:hypothetical protein
LEACRRLDISIHERDLRIFPREQDVWVAYDNTSGDCWVEEFKTEKEAKKYCYLNE